ncbi:MAG: hypothetical protein QNJ12_05695 [Ilumatobacter sp.]|uniref:hypothetical protein n=1 Tax=Ilumatobacter sp. TaxID=1967498 RepID=UPI002634687B|nr:hypothetical protein [Ilumatobacter sp.]MDJ0768264.1 hypothetical protein [Ilumatobacter sp.]
MSVVRTLAMAACSIATIIACGSSESDEPRAAVAIVEVVEDVEYYIGCANEPVEVDGTLWYPLADFGFGFADEIAEILDTPREPLPTAPVGLARVAEPGPGDDVGTLVVYADGVAHYTSDSGQTIWLTVEEQTYEWVC